MSSSDEEGEEEEAARPAQRRRTAAGAAAQRQRRGAGGRSGGSSGGRMAELDGWLVEDSEEEDGEAERGARWAWKVLRAAKSCSFLPLVKVVPRLFA